MDQNITNTDDFIKLVTDSIENQRKEELLSELKQSPESEKIYNKVKAAWAFLASTNHMTEYEIESSYKKLHSRLNSRNTTFRLKINSLFKYAAIIVLFLSTMSLTFYLRNQFLSNSDLKYTSVIARNKQISEVVLPDSSVVCLNSGSVLTYDNYYMRDNRNLIISGEAYFDIKKNKKIPLTVSFSDLKVKVLGTKFNVRAYPDNQRLSVALESGVVEISHLTNSSINYKLKPGEIAEYDATRQKVTIKKIAIGDFTAWRNGLLVFKDRPMDEVLKVIQRKFDVEFLVEDEEIYEPVFNATFTEENLTEVLDFIKYTCHIDYLMQKDNSTTIVKLYKK